MYTQLSQNQRRCVLYADITTLNRSFLFLTSFCFCCKHVDQRQSHFGYRFSISRSFTLVHMATAMDIDEILHTDGMLFSYDDCKEIEFR